MKSLAIKLGNLIPIYTHYTLQALNILYVFDL